MQNQPVEETVTTEEGVHYGEINFSRLRSGPSSVSEQDGGQQEDTLYAQVKVSKAADNVTRTADVPEDLYAQVKRKWAVSCGHIWVLLLICFLHK